MKSIHEQVHRLTDVLSVIKDTLFTMLELEDQKYEAIKDMDFNTLSLLNEQEEVLVSKINLQENQRQDVMERLSAMVGFDPESSISSVVHRFPEECRVVVQNLCLDIRNICDRIAVATERNRYVLSNNSEIFSQIFEIAQGKDGTNDQYTSAGTSHESQTEQFFLLNQIV